MWAQLGRPRRGGTAQMDPTARALLSTPTLPPLVAGLRRGEGAYAEAFTNPLVSESPLPPVPATVPLSSAPPPPLPLPLPTSPPPSTSPPPPLPAVPAWVRPQKETKGKNQVALARNARLVRAANAAGTQYDFVLYGDSITRNMVDKAPGVWAKFFGHLKAAPLGVGGHTVEELSYRLAKGGEVLKPAPKVVAVLIGINNIKMAGRRQVGDPAPNVDSFLVPYLKAVYPQSKIMLLGLLPNKTRQVAATNAKYKTLAAKHGVDYVDCSADINAGSPADLADGTHPAPGGYVKMFTCLRPLVDAAVRAPNVAAPFAV